MFGWFKSKEKVTVVPAEDSETNVLTVRNALVLGVGSIGPDPWTPHRIDFEWREKLYSLTGAGLLKNVCEAVSKCNKGDKVYFSAVLTIEGNEIVKVDYPDKWN